MSMVAWASAATSTGRPALPGVSLNDPEAGGYVEVVVCAGPLVGATCVGDADVATTLSALYTRSLPVPDDPAQLLVRALAGGGRRPRRATRRARRRRPVCRATA